MEEVDLPDGPSTPYWESKSLEELSEAEWESLCDGCGLCCLIKLEDTEEDAVYYTRVVCKYLNEHNTRCGCYVERSAKVPDCIWLTPEKTRTYKWLPSSCAYRLISEGKSLHWWHHLVSGDRQTVHEAGISIRGRVLSEEFVHPESYDEHIIKWVDH